MTLNSTRLRRGLDIKLEGDAQKIVSAAKQAELYAVVPSNYVGITPRLLVKEGDAVEAGTPLFFDKDHSEVLFPSPVSGIVKEVVRGDKRKILAITIENDHQNRGRTLRSPKSNTAESVKEFLLDSGLWSMLIQRPFGVIANPTDIPRAIFTSTFDSSPLAPDMGFILSDRKEDIERGINMISHIAPVHIGVGSDSFFERLKGAKTTTRFLGKHPAGNVGAQIANSSPINRGEVVWTIDIQHLAMLGSMIKNGEFNLTKTIAITGSEVKTPQYIQCISGAPISSLTQQNIKNGTTQSPRFISGNPLTGHNVGHEGFLGFYNNQITILPEGDKYEFLGWAMPRINKFSVSRSYFSWLMPGKKYNLDTNINGGQRAFVMSNSLYEKVFPMDIYPVYLLKAIMAFDIDRMEQLGIYEIIEEDIALCEFICPSKIEWQAILREGITKMIKEL